MLVGIRKQHLDGALQWEQDLPWGIHVNGERNRLASELELYKLRKDGWLGEHSGHYVVVKGTDVLGFYPTFVMAYSAGASAWGPDMDFLVKQVLEHEPIFSVF